MIKAGVGERRQTLRRQTDRRGNQIVVETCLARGFDDLGEIAPRGRLAAGQMHLQHAESGRFAEHPRPGRGVEFIVALVERERIGAIGTAERAPVRQFGQQAERRRQLRIGVTTLFAVDAMVDVHNSSNFLSARPPSSFTTSA